MPPTRALLSISPFMDAAEGAVTDLTKHRSTFPYYSANQEQRGGGVGRGWLYGAAGYCQGPLHGGGWPRPTPLQGQSVAATAPLQGGCQPPARGLLATYKGPPPAGAIARKGRPPVGTAGCGQPARGCHGAPARGERKRLVRKGLPAARPQGVAASRGDGSDRKGGRPFAGRLPAATCSVTACAGAATAATTQEGEEEG
ncbi:hypothetical protein BHE74_00057562 [Ensete ventricosum]|nr:hypothetical protein BHE74_00057562 [Ensete ventricosum]